MHNFGSSTFSQSRLIFDGPPHAQARQCDERSAEDRPGESHRDEPMRTDPTKRPSLHGALIRKSRPLFDMHMAEAQQTGAKAAATLPETAASLSAFGMFWKRNHVHWPGRPRLLGQRKASACHVNFADQIGVYLLHDRERTIYVGRTLETLHARLKTHTVDRLAGRWDRFSWFGLRGVSGEGALTDIPHDGQHSILIETMEALLIETLEPPLNRKRGDRLTGLEYLQVADPEVERAARKRLLADLIRTVGLESL